MIIFSVWWNGNASDASLAGDVEVARARVDRNRKILRRGANLHGSVVDCSRPVERDDGISRHIELEWHVSIKKITEEAVQKPPTFVLPTPVS